MGEPDAGREADELIEPLFAGLSGAEHERDAALPQDPPADPWKHPRPALSRREAGVDLEREPATFPLAIKALALMIVLFLLGALVYMAFGA